MTEVTRRHFIKVAGGAGLVALSGVFDLGLSAVLDAFQTANELIEASGLAVPPFDVRVVGLRRAVKTSHGFRVPVNPVGGRTPDCVVVPAIGYKMPGPLEEALARPDVRDAAAALREMARRRTTMTAALGSVRPGACTSGMTRR